MKLRTSNITFPIETGPWMGIPRDERLCNLCNLCIGNEFHYMFCCELLKDIRTKYMPNYFIICPCEAEMNTMLKIGNTSSYSPVIVPPKNCKTSVVLNVHFKYFHYLGYNLFVIHFKIYHALYNAYGLVINIA